MQPQLHFDIFVFWVCLKIISKKNNVASIDGIKIKSIQVAAPDTEREDLRQTSTTLAAYRTEGQQTTRLNLKMSFTNENKIKIYNV